LKAPSSSGSFGAERIAFLVCCALIAAVGCAYLLFLDREFSFDETHLWNASYMYQHYGRMTFPVHGQPNYMTIHPPTHYGVIAIGMKAGLSLGHAASAEATMLWLAAMLLLALAPFAAPLRYGLLLGVFLGALVWNDIFTVRPDLAVALAWSGGLIGLESGRLAKWSLWRLAAGSVLLCYASTLHYPAAFGCLGLAVYVAWAWVRLPWRTAMAATGAMATGPVLVTLPFAALFVLPMRREILAIVHDVQSGARDATPWSNHLLSYAWWLRDWPNNVAYQPLTQRLLWPAWASHIPLALIGPAILLAFRRHTPLALAALPQVLFLVLFARHKQTGYPGYFAPEAVLYLSAVLAALLAGAYWLCGRLGERRAATVAFAAVAGVLTLAALHDRPSVAPRQRRWTADLDEMDAARAASKALLGPNALVGTTSAGVWYTSGAAHHYSLFADLTAAPSVAGLDIKALLAPFEAAAFDGQQSWLTHNRERLALVSYYVRGDLRLKGFWFADRRDRTNAALSMLLLSPNTSAPPSGYGLSGGRMHRFDPAPDGDQTLVCAVCPLGGFDNEDGRFPYFVRFILPGADNADPRASPQASASRLALRMFLLPRARYERDAAPALTGCTIRDRVDGRLTPVDRARMVAELRRTDRPIRFYERLESALSLSGRYNRDNTERLADAMRFAPERGGGEDAVLERSGGGFRIVTPKEPGLQAAWIPVSIPPGVTRGFLYVRGSVARGRVSLRLCRDVLCSEPAAEMIRDQADGLRELYLPVRSLSGVERLLIRNGRTGEESEMMLEDAAIAVARPAAAGGENWR